MAKRPSGFPKELSQPIIWSGPKFSEAEEARSPFAPSRGLLDFEPNTPLSALPDDERERILQERKEILAREEAAHKEVDIERFHKLLLLCDHFNIKIDETKHWQLNLCMALANEFFEGMKVNFEQRRGRPKKWDATVYLELWAAIEDIKIDRKCGDADACRNYVKRVHGRADEKRARYYVARLTEARNPKNNWFAKVFQGTPEYERYMIDVLISNFGPEDSKSVLDNTELLRKHGVDSIDLE